MASHEHNERQVDIGQGRFAGVERLIPEVHEPVEMPPRFDVLTNSSLGSSDSGAQETVLVDNLTVSRFSMSPETSTILQWVTAATIALVDKHRLESSDWRQTAIALALSGIAYLVTTSNERY